MEEGMAEIVFCLQAQVHVYADSHDIALYVAGQPIMARAVDD